MSIHELSSWQKIKKDVLKIRAIAFDVYTGVYYSKYEPNLPPLFLDIDDMSLKFENITIDKTFEYSIDRYGSAGKALTLTDVNISNSIIKKDVMEYYIDFQPKEMTIINCLVEE